MHKREIDARRQHVVDRDRPPGQAGQRRRSSCASATPWCSSRPATRQSEREGIDFLPLTVDYREYTYASGRIPGGFFKREGKATEKEVLTSRCIDRPLRPLFPAGWHHETQVIALVLSADENYDPDVLAITGASAALAFSAIPFEKTMAGVRVGLVDGAFVINPTLRAAQGRSTLDIVVAGSKDGLVMVEAGAKEVARRRHRAGPRGRRTTPSSQIVAMIDEMARGGRQDEACRSRRRPSTPTFYREVEAKVLRAARRGDAHQGQARELRAASTRCSTSYLASFPEEEVEQKARGEERLQGTEGEGAARRDPRARPAPRRPHVRRDPPDLDRGRRAAPHARLGRLHARRDPGARHRHARHRPTTSRRSRWSTARPTSGSCCTTTSRRSRSAKWRSCAAPAAARSATAPWPSARWRR